jgi:hypothetical protein
MNLGAGHKKAAIRIGFDGIIERRPKARPTGPAVKLRVGCEERLAAAGAVINALAVFLVELAGASALGAVFAKHMISRGRQFTPPFLFAHLYGKLLVARVRLTR